MFSMEVLSSNDSEEEDSDELSKEREEELYAVLHYNDFSQGVPPELLEKYCISNDENEFVISLRNSPSKSKPSLDGSESPNPRCGGMQLIGSSSRDFSQDESVIDEVNSSQLTRATADNKGSNSKKRYWEDDGEEKSTVSTNKRKSGEPSVTPVSRDSQNKVEENQPKGKSRKLDSKEVQEDQQKVTLNSRKRKSANDPEQYAISDEEVEFKKVPNPKYKSYSSETSSAQPMKSGEEVVVEDDSDDSSCVIVEDPDASRKISISSSADSVVAVVTSEDEADFSLNTTGDVSYDSDGNVSDVIENTQFDWREVASPSSWTLEMRKYYNSTCERLRYFDHKKIRQVIRTGNRKDWTISHRDLFPSRRPQQRCLICRQTDHLAKNCPKKDPTCHMCGVQGHSNFDCPNSLCLQCGKTNRQFTSVCQSCAYTLRRECYTCKQTGHESRTCPEKWREFHSTTEGPLKKGRRHENDRPPQCCNCGRTDHTFEECNQQPMSDFSSSLPAYNWLRGRESRHENWRVGFSGFSPHTSFAPPFKRRRRGDRRDSITDGIPVWIPTSKDKSKKKKKKKRQKQFHNSF